MITSIDIDKLLASRSQTETGKKLRDMLFKISDDKEFVCGVLGDLEDDKKKEILIHELEIDPDFTDTSEINNLSMAIEEGSYP